MLGEELVGKPPKVDKFEFGSWIGTFEDENSSEFFDLLERVRELGGIWARVGEAWEPLRCASLARNYDLMYDILDSLFHAERVECELSITLTLEINNPFDYEVHRFTLNDDGTVSINYRGTPRICIGGKTEGAPEIKTTPEQFVAVCTQWRKDRLTMWQ